MRLGEAIVFHPSIHGFRSGRGTGTAILEAKLLMQLFACEANPLFQVFLDLTKAYDSLDRDRTMVILAAYGIGPRTCRLIQAIWDSDTMFPKQAGIYGEPFRAQRGVRQGDVISPDIFNIIVDCVIREWYHQTSAFVPDPLLALSALFYADDGKLAGSNPSLVQTGLDLFVQLFRRIGLELNATKTQTMICLGPKPLGHMSTMAYKRRFDQSFPTHRERKLSKVLCHICSKAMNNQYLPIHLRDIHGIRDSIPTVPIDSSEGKSYTIHMPLQGFDTPCPVIDCPAHPSAWALMRNHFTRMHTEAELIIPEDPLICKCPSCGAYVRYITERHLASQTCKILTQRRSDRVKLKNRSEILTSTKFYACGTELTRVSDFSYLGRWISDDDDDTQAVLANIKKARLQWGCIYRILQYDGTPPKTMAHFYMAVVQSVLLYGSETWVLTKRLLQRLERFHARCARHMAHRHIRHLPDGTWQHPHTDQILEICGLSPISAAIAKRKTTLLHYATTYSQVYRRCLATRRRAHPNHLVWWDLDS
jgi:hypothetical protein